MGMRQRLAALAASRVHVLLVEVPGWASCRIAAERTANARGWPLASSPAGADVLVVCGHPGPEFADVTDRVWEQLPGPRARVQVSGPDEVGAGLDQAVAALLDAPGQRRDARGRGADPPGPEHDMDHGGMDHGGMEMPGGIPMADRASDRDGLTLDVLHVPLGPILPQWPPGLVLRCVLQGDVITGAGTQVLPATGEPPGSGWTGGARGIAAAYCDSAARLLAVAGWEDQATAVRRERDALLDGAPAQQCAAALDRHARRVRRSRTLRWLLSDLGVLDVSAAARYQLSGPAARAPGDVLSRLVAWLDEAGDLLRGEPVATGEGPRGHLDGGQGSAALLRALPDLVTGLDVGTARLVVASLDPDTAELVRRTDAAHGADQ